MNFIESEVLELKREFNDKAIRTAVAFANTKGGKIYIGVDDNGEAIGVENVDETQLAISNSIEQVSLLM